MHNYLANNSKVLVISLPKRTDRRMRVEKEVRKTGLPFDFSSGVTIPIGDVKPEWTANFWDCERYGIEKTKYIEGSVGCKLAHINAIKTCLANTCTVGLIFEDDILIDHGLWQNSMTLFEARFSHTSDWDIVYFGGLLAYQGATITAEGIYPATNIIHASAYVLSRKAMQITVDKALDSGREIDLFYQHEFCNEAKTGFAILPFAARQATDFSSDIR